MTAGFIEIRVPRGPIKGGRRGKYAADVGPSTGIYVGPFFHCLTLSLGSIWSLPICDSRRVADVADRQGDGARVQAFQRVAGWTWVVCGLGFATASLVLPITRAERAANFTEVNVR